MDLAYAAADLAICRGGASTVAELAATSTPAIILPYPHHRDRQQELNAAELVAAGGALRVADAANVSSNVAALRSTLLPVMADDATLARMKLCAGGVARPHASRDVARWLAGREDSC
jgi:UDP-N-acetylglucosamine--N-acetylmuramyl-(pentapeptide) pyrophosphoryl-undecaprenol N-acetylglucosamine transferase